MAFVGDVDGAIDSFLGELVDRAGPGLGRIFAHCEGFAGAERDFQGWLKNHNVAPAVNYVNYVGRTVKQVREEAALHASLSGHLQAMIDDIDGMDPRELRQRLVDAAVDWDRTLAFREHLWSLGFGVAEAMDTAQRGMGLDWPTSLELIRRSVAQAKAGGHLIASGAGTDHIAPGPDVTVDDVIAAYEMQCEAAEAALAQAEAALETAEGQVTLAEAGVNTARTQVEIAEGQLAQAAATRDRLQAGATDEEIAVLAAQVAQAEGLLAVCIQHEMDHLEGVLFIDYLSRLKRNFAVNKVRKAQKRVIA